MIVVSALDHRFGWSPVPTTVSLVGDVLVAIGLGAAMLVVVQNSYAAATITVEAGQTSAPIGDCCSSSRGILGLVFRILDEEKLLTQDLAGYREYTRRVRYRVVPQVW